MPNQTKEKLSEAGFFLVLMKENRGKVQKFNQCLNAFICSARSIRWIMKYEYLNVPGWNDWIKEKDETRTEAVEALYKGTTAMRNHAQKRGPLQATASYTLQFSKADLDQLVGQRGRVSVSMSGTTGHCTLYITQENGQQAAITSTKVTNLRRQVTHFPSQDVIHVCQSYYDHLSALVAECLERFGSGEQETDG